MERPERLRIVRQHVLSGYTGAGLVLESSGPTYLHWESDRPLTEATRLLALVEVHDARQACFTPSSLIPVLHSSERTFPKRAIL